MSISPVQCHPSRYPGGETFQKNDVGNHDDHDTACRSHISSSVFSKHFRVYGVDEPGSFKECRNPITMVVIFQIDMNISVEHTTVIKKPYSYQARRYLQKVGGALL